MVTERIKLVVIDEHTLGYLIPNSNYAGVLHASVLRGSPVSGSPLSAMNPIPVAFKKVRLASEKDFNDFRVSFEGYKKNKNEYEFAEN